MSICCMEAMNIVIEFQKLDPWILKNREKALDMICLFRKEKADLYEQMPQGCFAEWNYPIMDLMNEFFITDEMVTNHLRKKGLLNKCFLDEPFERFD
jgi:hypothetical protein